MIKDNSVIVENFLKDKFDIEKILQEIINVLSNGEQLKRINIIFFNRKEEFFEFIIIGNDFSCKNNLLLHKKCYTELGEFMEKIRSHPAIRKCFIYLK